MFCDTACQRCVPGGDTGVPCETDDQCQEINNPPEVSKTVAAPADYCTGIPATQLVGFTWEYSDVDDDRQSAYVFEISQSSAQNEDGSFAEPFITRSMLCDLNVFSGDPYCSVSNEQLVQVKLSASESQEQLDFETLYYWHVKVTDAKGQDSEWSETESFTYKDLSGASSHPAPSPFYSADKNAVAPGSTINFYNNSICYNDEGSTDCENYIWNFGDGPEETVDTKESQTHEYGIDKKKGSYATSLKACDEVGCCSATLDLPIKAAGPTDLPRWKEITPFLVP